MSVSEDQRDSVTQLSTSNDLPWIVGLSDVHGYLDEAHSALLALNDHPNLPPVVKKDKSGNLHWAGENYVLVLNGDMINRGPSSEAVLDLALRLIEEAPPGCVRYVLGNHEAMALTPGPWVHTGWYSTRLSSQGRQAFIKMIQDGHIVAAYEGHNHTWVHAGSPGPLNASDVNDQLLSAANNLWNVSIEDIIGQEQALKDYAEILGMGEPSLKGPGAGLVWLAFKHLPSNAPPQVVGHTPHREPTRKGNVVCQDVILRNIDSPGGEGVIVETPDNVFAVRRKKDGGVSTREV